MMVYTVHIKPYSFAADGDAVFVKEGFCWPAAVIPIFWAAYRRLWRWLLILVLAEVALSFVGREIDFLFQLPLAIAFFVFVGCSGNDWRRAGLSRRGYALADIVVAKNLMAAERRYFDRAAAARPQSATAVP